MMTKTCEYCLWCRMKVNRMAACHRPTTNVVVTDTKSDKMIDCYVRVRGYYTCDYFAPQYKENKYY